MSDTLPSASEHAEPGVAVPIGWEDRTEPTSSPPWFARRACGVELTPELERAVAVLDAALVLADPGTTADALMSAVARARSDA